MSSLPTTILTPNAAVPTASSLRTGRATLSILVPSQRPGVRILSRQHPNYISSATASVVLAIGTVNLGSVNVGANSPNCKPVTNGYSCTATFEIPIGSNTFTLSAFDGPNGGGKLLSTGSVVATIVAGSANTIAATLGGVIASIVFGQPAAKLVQGTQSKLPIVVTALDADGRTIVSDPYSNPISLSGGDTNSAVLSTSNVTSPAASVSIAYDGSRLAAVTITASAQGASSASLTIPPPKMPFTDDWLVFGHDPQHTGSDANETAITASNASGITQFYAVPMTSFVNAQPAIADNVDVNGKYGDYAYVGDEHGYFVAFDVESGAILWKQQLGSVKTGCYDVPDGVWGITGTAYIDRPSNRVYVVDGQDILWAFDLATGKIAGPSATLPSWPTGGVSILPGPGTASQEHAYGGPTFDSASGTVFLPTASLCDHAPWNGRVIGVGVASPGISSSFTTVPSATAPSGSFGGGIWGPGGVSFDPRGNGDLYSAIGNAEPIDRSGFGDEVAHWDSTLNLLGANLADASDQTKVVDADLDFGATPVTFQASGCPPQLFVVQKSGVGYLYNLDDLRDTNQPPEYKQALTIGADTAVGVNISTAAFANDSIFVANGSSNPSGEQRGLIAYSVSGCKLQKRWAFASSNAGPAPNSPPTVVNGVAYDGGGDDQVVRAFDASGGALLWTSASTGHAIYAAPSFADGRLFVSSWDKSVHVYSVPKSTPL